MVRVGILGAGFMVAPTPGLREAIRRSDRRYFVSLRDKAAALAKEFGAEPFTDAMALVTDPRIDAVSITLPTRRTWSTPEQRWQPASMCYVRSRWPAR